MDETASKDWKILLGKASDAPPSPHSSTEELGNQKKSDSTTVKPIAEPYLLASVNFYLTAIIYN